MKKKLYEFKSSKTITNKSVLIPKDKSLQKNNKIEERINQSLDTHRQFFKNYGMDNNS